MTEEYINMVLKNFGKGDILLLQNEINRVDMLIDKAKEKKNEGCFKSFPI